MGTITYITADGRTHVINATPGTSVMQLATANGIPGIEAECGGCLSCATCHVYVEADWFGRIGAAGDNERAMLEFAEDPGPTSRLSCQIRYTDELDGLVVRIPETQ